REIAAGEIPQRLHAPGAGPAERLGAATPRGLARAPRSAPRDGVTRSAAPPDLSALMPNGSLACSPPSSSPREVIPARSVQTNASCPRSVVPVPATVFPSALAAAA